MKTAIVAILLLLSTAIGECSQVIEADIITAHRASEYGSQMYYISQKNNILYIVMHGSEDGLVMDGISIREAIWKILRDNKKKLTNPFAEINVICCYSNQHKGYFDKKRNLKVNFLANSDKKLKVNIKNHQISFEEID